MSLVTIESPPILAASKAEDFQKISSYLFRTMRVLGDALNSLTPEKIEANARQMSPSSSSTSDSKDSSQYDELRSIIIKTANIVRSEMDTLFTSLSGTYVALSDYGSYTEATTNTITANSQGIIQLYDYQSTLESHIGELQTYVIDTQGYIKTGEIYQENGMPVYGVEIGQQLSDSTFRCRIVSNRMGFWEGETEVAYASNKRWYCLGLDVGGDIKLQEAWRITGGKGEPFEINYIA